MPGNLFDDVDPLPLAARLSPALRALAERGVYLGTSSWKYEGWLGTIYTPERYFTRMRFSRKKFEAECLREYAETFPVVGGDFSFYQFPSPEHWAQLFSGVPLTLGFGLKVPEEITVKTWPGHARYGPRAGLSNERFLDAALFERAFTKLLGQHHDRVAVLMFEFGTFFKKEFPTAEDFLKRLDGFLGALPGGWRYAVEIRNKEYLTPDYFAVLARHKVAHVFNGWTRMPTLADQIALPGAFTTDFTVVRALLQKGRTYEQAVKMFEPYREVQQTDPPTRGALRGIISRALKVGERAYVFINNRLEGNAPATIEAVVSAADVPWRGGIQSQFIARGRAYQAHVKKAAGWREPGVSDSHTSASQGRVNAASTPFNNRTRVSLPPAVPSPPPPESLPSGGHRGTDHNQTAAS
jgi:uncharacterized protein YecE (DUF72 family)